MTDSQYYTILSEIDRADTPERIADVRAKIEEAPVDDIDKYDLAEQLAKVELLVMAKKMNQASRDMRTHYDRKQIQEDIDNAGAREVDERLSGQEGL